VRLSPLGTSATNWPIVPAPDDDDECGTVGGMRIGRGNRSTRRKPAPVPLCSPQIPHDQAWARTRAAAVGNRRLTALSYDTAYMQTSKLIISIPSHVITGEELVEHWRVFSFFLMPLGILGVASSVGISPTYEILLRVAFKGTLSFQYGVIHMYVCIDLLYGLLHTQPVFSSRKILNFFTRNWKDTSGFSSWDGYKCTWTGEVNTCIHGAESR
jgi:hypothetical protein